MATVELVLVYYELRKSLDTCLIVDMSEDMSACQWIAHALLAGGCLAGPWRDLPVSLKVTPSSFQNILLKLQLRRLHQYQS